jgi:hypothetical protein
VRQDLARTAASLARWTPADLDTTFVRRGETLTRQ